MSKILVIIIFTVIIKPELKAQWVTEFGSSSQILQYINVIDTGTIWCLGFSSLNPRDTALILRKTPYLWWDYGEFNDLPNGVLYEAIAGIDTNIAFVGDENGKVYKTTNGGLNWLQVLSGGILITDIRFSKVNKNVGYVFGSEIGGYYRIFRTTDYGNSWQLQTPYLGSDEGTLRGGWVTDSLHAWYGLYCYSCSVAKVAFTSNGGISWNTSVVTPSWGQGVRAAFKTDNQFGITGLWKHNAPNIDLYRSSNGGNSWISYYTVQPFDLEALLTVPGTSVWYLGENGNYAHIYKSSNDGTNWFQMVLEDSTKLVFDIDAVRLNGKIYAWAVAGQIIFKLVDTASVIGISNNGNGIPVSYNLYQNFPNPFNPETKIKYDLPKNTNVTIKVYDLLGRLVSTLVNNEFRNAGRYDVIWNANNFASGIYIYKIEAGTFIETKKMVLVK